MKAKWSLGPLLVICAALARQARRNLNRPPIRSQSPRLRHLQRHLSLRSGLWSTTTLEPKPAILIATSRRVRIFLHSRSGTIFQQDRSWVLSSYCLNRGGYRGPDGISGEHALQS